MGFFNTIHMKYINNISKTLNKGFDVKVKWWVVLLIVVIIGLVVFFAYKYHNKVKKDVITNINELTNQKTESWRNERGQLISKVQELRADLASIKTYYGGVIDSFSEELGISDKNLRHFKKLAIQTQRNDLKVKLIKDTIEGEPCLSYFRYSDNWLDMSGSINSDSMNIDFLTTWNNITIAHYLKRKKWYSLNKTMYVFVKDENPYTTNLGVESVEVFIKPKRFVVSTGIGYGVNLSNSQLISWKNVNFNIVHVGYKLFEF